MRILELLYFKQTIYFNCFENMKNVKKQHLPDKICLQCQRPFTWRKKWERDWENVKFCSERCKVESKKRAASI